MIKTAILAATAALVALPTMATEHNISMYPEALEGYTRHIIELPPKEDESLAKVVLRASRTMLADCNLRGLPLKMKQETVEGWGYSYYIVDVPSEFMTTMMACPEPAVEKVVYTQLGEPVRYNSRLPLVVYVTEGHELEYGISEIQSFEPAPAR